MSDPLGHGLAPSPNEFSANVFHGIWERFDEPSFRRLKWTLTNTEALIVMALLTSLNALAQSESWEIIRCVIAHHKKSIRFPDSKPDPLFQISQGEAISDAMSLMSKGSRKLWKRIRRAIYKESTPPNPAEDADAEEAESPLISPLFGVFGILNVAVFVIMSVVIPIWLAEGALGAPIVKSKATGECLNSTWWDSLPYKINRQTKTDETFHLCRDKLDAGCDSQYYLSKPQIQKTRPKECPFSGNICHKNSTPFEITHYNISAYHVGVNSRSHVIMNHRLTCSPVSVENFILYGTTPEGERNVLTVQTRPRIGETTYLEGPLMINLITKNGPNSESNESSGRYMALKKEKPKLTLLPQKGPLNDIPGVYSYSQDKLAESLRRDDGQPFLIVL
jgi:hypothetical protein